MDVNAEINKRANALKLLEFVDAQVLNGYDELVKTGEQYYTDATMIDDIVKDVLKCSIESRLLKVMKREPAMGSLNRLYIHKLTYCILRLYSIACEFVIYILIEYNKHVFLFYHQLTACEKTCKGELR